MNSDSVRMGTSRFRLHVPTPRKDGLALLKLWAILLAICTELRLLTTVKVRQPSRCRAEVGRMGLWLWALCRNHSRNGLHAYHYFHCTFEMDNEYATTVRNFESARTSPYFAIVGPWLWITNYKHILKSFVSRDRNRINMKYQLLFVFQKIIVNWIFHLQTLSLLFSFIAMPDNGNTRILHFVGYDLGKKVTLMLTFQPPNVRKLYQDEFPLCWGKSC